MSHPSNSLATTAAKTAAGLYAAFAAMQLALAGGAPWGEHVWGGGNDAVLPPNLRISSLVAAVALLWIAAVVLARVDAIPQAPAPRRWLPPITWAIAGLMALNTVGNIASQSAFERWVFGPVTAVLAILTAIVALQPRPAPAASQPQPV